MDRSPLKADSFDISWIGPDIRNLLIPKDEANRLKRKVKSGKAELISEQCDIVFPPSFFGWNPSIANKIASEILTCNKKILFDDVIIAFEMKKKSNKDNENR